MHYRAWAICAAIGVTTGLARGQTAGLSDDAPASPSVENMLGPSLIAPVRLALVDEPQSVYPQIAPPRDDEGINAGAVHFDVDVSYLSTYVYRGVDQTTTPKTQERALQFDGKAEFDLGKLPHPFVGLFVNVFNSDPISRFEEVRPNFGLDWTIKPITFSGGYTSYIFPNRKGLDTQEAFARIMLDDSRIFHTERPLLAPYVFGAYDLNLYKGFYLEAGIRHDFVFEDVGLTLTPNADIAYVVNNPQYEIMHGPKSGLQHYDVNLTATYSLNHLFNTSRRYGEWSVRGYLTYTAQIDKQLRADTLIWGGVGLNFSY
ncbi:MAG TPA: hypothetical protein VG269_18845 [Tepidisphaeraceae bacterium]|jgi:hypothetical protein|nr:hypothetical protein [Tepidisphaeraceae bacterium]